MVNTSFNFTAVGDNCLPAGWQVKLHRSFPELATEWQALTAEVNVSVFETYEWLSVWYQTLGQRQGYQLFLFSLYDEDNVIRAIIPLGTYPQNSLTALGFLGGEVTDYRAPIVHPDCWQKMHPDQFLQLWVHLVEAVPEVDLIDIKRMKDNLSGIPNPLCHLSYVTPNEQAHAALLPEHYDTFQETRKSRLFADIRRQKKRLAEVGELSIVEVVPVSAQKQLMDTLVQQKSQRWKESHSRDLFAEPGYINFYQTLSQQSDSDVKVVMSGVHMNQTWIATHWGIRYGQTFYWILPTYDNGEWNRYSAGKILLDAMVQWSIHESIQVFDLTVGDEEYKQQWANRTQALYGGLYGMSLRGRLYVIWHNLKAKLKQQLKKNQIIHQGIQTVKRLISNK